MTKSPNRPKRTPTAAQAPRHGDDDLNNRIFFRLFQVMNRYERQAQREVGYSGVQGAVMGALSLQPEHGVAFSDLVEHLAVSRQNLDGVLKRLEKLDYLERFENPSNRRIKLVRLTPLGIAAWEELIARSLVFYRRATQGIEPPDKTHFFETLIRIGRGLKTMSSEPAPAHATTLPDQTRVSTATTPNVRSRRTSPAVPAAPGTSRAAVDAPPATRRDRASKTPAAPTRRRKAGEQSG